MRALVSRVSLFNPSFQTVLGPGVAAGSGWCPVVPPCIPKTFCPTRGLPETRRTVRPEIWVRVRREGQIGAVTKEMGALCRAPARRAALRVSRLRGIGITCALHEVPRSRCATRRGAPRGAACGPLPAVRCIAHSHTSSGRTLEKFVALASIRAQRLRDGDPRRAPGAPPRRPRDRSPSPHHTRDGSAARPPTARARVGPASAARVRARPLQIAPPRCTRRFVRRAGSVRSVRSHREQGTPRNEFLLQSPRSVTTRPAWRQPASRYPSGSSSRGPRPSTAAPALLDARTGAGAGRARRSVREPGQRLEELPQHGRVVHVAADAASRPVGRPRTSKRAVRVDRQRCAGPKQRVVITLPTSANGRGDALGRGSRRVAGRRNSRSDSRSVTTRLISSGMVQSRLPQPPRPARRAPELCGTSAAATVSSHRRTSDEVGAELRRSPARRCITAAVCCACDPDPTPRSWSGAGITAARKGVDIPGSWCAGWTINCSTPRSRAPIDGGGFMKFGRAPTTERTRIA